MRKEKNMCLKKEFTELFQNKKLWVFLIVIYTSELLICLKKIENQNLFLLILFLFTIFQVSFDNLKSDLDSGAFMFLINKKVSWSKILFSKFFILFLMSLVFFLIMLFYCELQNSLKIFLTLEVYTYLVFNLCFIFFVITKSSDIVSFLCVFVLGLIFSKLHFSIFIFLAVFETFLFRLSFFSKRFRSYICDNN